MWVQAPPEEALESKLQEIVGCHVGARNQVSVLHCWATSPGPKKMRIFRSYKDDGLLVILSYTFLSPLHPCASRLCPKVSFHLWNCIPGFSWLVSMAEVKVQIGTESVMYKLPHGPCQEAFFPSVNEAIFYNCSDSPVQAPSNEELNKSRQRRPGLCKQLEFRFPLISLWHWEADCLPSMRTLSVVLWLQGILGTFFCRNYLPLR